MGIKQGSQLIISMSVKIVGNESKVCYGKENYERVWAFRR